MKKYCLQQRVKMKTCSLPTEILNNKPLTNKRIVILYSKYFETSIGPKNNNILVFM